MNSQPESLPVVSVIMPIRNEAKFIQDSLAAVLAQDYPAHLLEVLVVDGMSNDGTRAVVSDLIKRRRELAAATSQNGNHAPSSTSTHTSPVFAFGDVRGGSPAPGVTTVQTSEEVIIDANSHDGLKGVWQDVIVGNGNGSESHRNKQSLNNTSPVYLLDNPRRVVPTALNVAIRRATGEVIIIVGGHALIESDYVRKCVNLLMKTGTDCVGGALDSVGNGYVGGAIAAAMSSPFGVGGSGFRVAAADAEPRLTDSVPFPAYRRDVFTRIGLYNEVMVRHQDYEFNYRLRKAGGKILLLPSIRVKYHVRSSFRSLWSQYWQYGLWKGSFLRAHPASLKLRHLIPPVFVLMLALSAFSALIPQMVLWASGLAPAAYAAFMVFGLIMVGRGGKLRYVPILPFVFACLHFSYGFGIWLGLVSPKTSRQSQPILLEPENAFNRVSN